MTVAAFEDSTNVRLPAVAAWALRVGSAVAPAWTAERAVDRFLRTSRRSSTPAQEAFRASGARVVLDLDGTAAVARSWGEGPPVYFLHGWNGSLTDFRYLVPAVVAAGFRAVAVDAPGHGESDGDSASAVHLARGLEAAARAWGPAAGVVAHSLGAAAAAFAIARGGVRTERLLLVAPVAAPARYLEAVAADTGETFASTLVRTLERRVGVAAADLRLEASAARIDVPALVLHDTEDRETALGPVAAAVAAWPGAALLRTDGLGHRRILADRAVGRAVVATLAGTNVRPCVHGHLPGACAACALERELYRREERAA